MELIIIIVVAIIAIIIIYSMMKTNIKELKKIAGDSELNKIAQKFPKNKEICKALLHKLGNKTTKIEKKDVSNSILLEDITEKEYEDIINKISNNKAFNKIYEDISNSNIEIGDIA